MKSCKVGENRKAYKVFHAELKSSEGKPVWGGNFNKWGVASKKGSRKALSCVCMLLILQVFSIGSLEKSNDYFVVLQDVEIHNYLWISTIGNAGNPVRPLTLARNPVSLNDVSAFDRSDNYLDVYDVDQEKLKELRDSLVQEKKEKENSQIDNVYPESGEISDRFIKIELKNHHVIYYDGIVLEHVIKLESYEFKSKDRSLEFKEPLGEQGHLYAGGMRNSAIDDTEEMRELLRKNNRTDSLSVLLIYTEVTAKRIVINTGKRILENRDQCFRFLKDDIALGERTSLGGDCLRFFQYGFAFTCSENARTTLERKIYWDIVLLYEINSILKEIKEDLDSKEGIRDNLFEILEKALTDKSREDLSEARGEFMRSFRVEYEKAIKDFVETKDFLRKGLEVYEAKSSWTKQFDIESDFTEISTKCERYLLDISILEKDFDLIKDLYIVEAYEEQIEEAQDTIEWAQRAIIVAVCVAAATTIISLYIQERQSRKLQRHVDKIMRHCDLLERKRANVSMRVTRYSLPTKMTRKGRE